MTADVLFPAEAGITSDEVGRGELRELLFDHIPAPDEAARQAMFDRTLSSDGPANDDLLPPDGLFDGRSGADPDPEDDVPDPADPHDHTQDWAADDGHSWDAGTDHGDAHVDPGPDSGDHHGDDGHPDGPHDVFHDGSPGSW
jgi:hypothetical protein